MPFMFEKLVVYQRAMAFANDTTTLIATLPRGARVLPRRRHYAG